MNNKIMASRNEEIIRAQEKLSELEVGSREYRDAVDAIKTLNDARIDDMKLANETRELEMKYAEEVIPDTFIGKVKWRGKKILNGVIDISKAAAPFIIPVAGTIVVKVLDNDQKERDNEHERGLSIDCMNFERGEPFTSTPSKKVLFRKRH